MVFAFCANSPNGLLEEIGANIAIFGCLNMAAGPILAIGCGGRETTL